MPGVRRHQGRLCGQWPGGHVKNAQVWAHELMWGEQMRVSELGDTAQHERMPSDSATVGSHIYAQMRMRRNGLVDVELARVARATGDDRRLRCGASAERVRVDEHEGGALPYRRLSYQNPEDVERATAPRSRGVRMYLSFSL